MNDDILKSPFSPWLSTAFSGMRNVTTLISFVGALWGLGSTEWLTKVWRFFHDSWEHTAIAMALFACCFGWGLYRKYKDRVFVTAGHHVGMTPQLAKDIAKHPTEEAPVLVPATEAKA